MNSVLILGSAGTLGSQLQKIYPDAAGWDREDVDVTDMNALRDKVSALGFTPGAIINCVAFNDVDGAEEHPEAAFALNAELPGKLAGYAAQLGIPLVHYSSNYVFSGVRGEYSEGDAPDPLSAYGRSKFGGEQRAIECGARTYVVRTAVIFGPRGRSEASKKSFVDLMLDLSLKRDALDVVSDEVNSVTYAPDLARHTAELLRTLPEPGIYHITNSGSASWFDLAKETFRLAGRNVEARPVPSTRFPRKALRPPKAVLLNTKLPPLRHWAEALAEFVRN